VLSLKGDCMGDDSEVEVLEGTIIVILKFDDFLKEMSSLVTNVRLRSSKSNK